MKKILSILGATGLVASTSLTVIACKSEQAQTFDNLKDINDYIKWSNLGKFSSEPTKEEILTKFHRFNRAFEEFEDHFEVDEIILYDQKEYELHYQAKIKVKEESNIYKKDSVNITYFVENDNRVDVDTLIKEIQLGSFRRPPTKNDILTRVLEKNPELKKSEIEVVKVDVDYAEINAISSSKIYWGYSFVYYDEKVDLSTWNLETALGDFATQPTLEGILNRLASKNPRRLKISEFGLIRKNNEFALISVVADSKYYYDFELELSYFVGRQDLKKVVSTTNLGFFDFYLKPEYWRSLSEWNQKQILIRVKELNPDLQIDQVFIYSFDGSRKENDEEITYRFVIHPHHDSTVYLGTVVLTYSYVIDDL